MRQAAGPRWRGLAAPSANAPDRPPLPPALPAPCFPPPRPGPPRASVHPRTIHQRFCARPPVTSTSRPPRVQVTCKVGADLGCSRNGAASFRRAGSARSKAGSAIGQTVMSTSPPAAPGLEPQPHLAAVLARVQRQAPAAVRRRGERRLHVGLDILSGKRQDDLIPLPGQIGRRFPVLQGATAAIAEMLADRRYSLRAGTEPLHDIGPIAMHRDADAFAWQGQRRVQMTFRNTIPVGADRIDPQLPDRVGLVRCHRHSFSTQKTRRP